MPWTFFGRTFGNNVTGPPATPTLAIADRATIPTGCTATVSGSTIGSLNTISYQVVSASFQPVPGLWTAAGSRTSDGDVDLDLPTGIYWFRCDSALHNQVTVSNLVFVGLSDGQAAVHERCLLALEAGLRTLIVAGKIPGITKTTVVYDQVELNLLGMDLPGIAVCLNLPGQVSTEQQLGGTNARDDIGYPCYLVFLDRSGGDYVANRPGYLLGRQRIFRYFRQQPLFAVPEVYTTKFETGPVLKIERGDYQIIGSVLIARPISREVRGA